MKRFLIRRDPKYHSKAAVRIMDEVLSHVPSNKHIAVFVFQDIKTLENSPPGVYYVVNKVPLSPKIIRADTHNYFYRYVVLNNDKRIQTFLVPRNV